MIDYTLLNRTIDESGLKLNALAEALGLSLTGFAAKRKENGPEWTNSQIEAFTRATHCGWERSQAIFFPGFVSNLLTNHD